jgi:flagellar basal-body rod modification protein FlgD
METSTLTSTPSTSLSGASSTARSSIDKDGFLKLLVAQLKHQDPTGAGQDPNQMVQQLTSFSSLEQAQQTNSLLAGLQSQTNALFQAQTASLVGKTAQVAGSGFTLSGGTATQQLSLSAAATVTVTVRDASGNPVATLPQGRLGAGAHTLTWDGRDTQGRSLPEGTYTTEVQATGEAGQAVATTTSLALRIDGVAFQADGVHVLCGGRSFTLASLLQISA